MSPEQSQSSVDAGNSDRKSRLQVQFEQILQCLVENHAITEQVAHSMAMPGSSEDIVPRLWELGVDDIKLARALAEIYKCPLFDGVVRSRDSLVRSAQDKCPWLIADGVLYVTNPYDRAQIEPLIRRKKDPRDSLTFNRLGVMAMSDFEMDMMEKANYDVIVSNQEVSGAWANTFVDDLLNEAINRKASDVHINPESHGAIIKLRVDGRLQVPAIPGLQTISRDRLRLVANNLMERVGKQNNYLEPCSGYLVFQAAHKQVSMRLEMAPVKVYSEIKPKLTIRVLNNLRGVGRLDNLGLSGHHVDLLRQLSRRANGMLIVTGPTGSGKSTTLKAILKDVRDQFPEKAIYTIEDPVEDQLDGITSLEVTQHMGFAKALKSLLRHDPDVIMVGEIRDSETAELALRASMTGHLVLTTLHTNDAHGAINRLRNLGLENTLLAENLLAVTAQRLVNRVCPYCSEFRPLSQIPDLHEAYFKLPALNQPKQKTPLVIQPDGCDRCNYGYTGRHLVNEIFVNDTQTEKLISEGVGGTEIRRVQQAAGRFQDLWDDGVRLATQGVTTLHALENRINPLQVARVSLPGAREEATDLEKKLIELALTGSD
ncbi:MAG: ATPase, T2SS/T4P/T4SS family [Ketobacteraceae bacterium]|nr:ATPase, T2SS/T4P/T4SS family [Ketobacteraceae bacterium]